MLKMTFHRLGIKTKADFFQFCVQFIKFGIVGFSNTFISIAIYYICIYIGLHYILSNSIAFAISVLNAYFWNSKFVFQRIETKSKKKLILIKVFASYGLTFIIGTVLLYLWVNILDISQYIAPLINLIITIPLNFILNKFWAFK